MHPLVHVMLAEQVPSGALQEQVSATTGEVESVKANVRTMVKTNVRTAAFNFLIEDCLLGEVETIDQFYTGPLFSISELKTRIVTKRKRVDREIAILGLDR